MSNTSAHQHESNAVETSAGTQIADLSARLQERDKLVDILTQRLEAAAEQLDRIRRTGGDRGGASQGGGGLSREMVQQQQSLTEKLEEAVDQWQEAQPQEALGRIEDRLDQIMEMVRNGSFVSKAGSGSGSAASRHIAAKEAAASVKTTPKAATTTDSGLTSWEAMKAQLMGEAPPKPAQTVDSTIEEESSGAGAGETTAAAPSEDEIIAGPLPVIIDVEQASLEELKEAVTTRDTYISTLLRQFRVVSGRQPIDWKAVRELAPEAMQAVFQNFEKRLKEELQREELDISLERAKVARERGQLDQIRTRLEREIRKMNVQPGQEAAGDDDPPTSAAATGTAANASGAGRWKGILGIGKGKK